MRRSKCAPFLEASAWEQTLLSLSRGGLGLCCLSDHSSAFYIASISVSGLFSAHHQRLIHWIDDFNEPVRLLLLNRLSTHHAARKHCLGGLSTLFRKMFANSSLPDKVHLLLVSSPHASAWLSAVPSPGLNLS